MKNIKVSMLALSLITVSVSASAEPTLSGKVEATKSVVASLVGKLPAIPAPVAKFVPANKYAQAALAAAAVTSLGYLTYKYGKTVCNKIASAATFVGKKAAKNKGMVLTLAGLTAAVVAAHKYGLDTKALAWVKSLFAKTQKVVIPAETPKKN